MVSTTLPPRLGLISDSNFIIRDLKELGSADCSGPVLSVTLVILQFRSGDDETVEFNLDDETDDFNFEDETGDGSIRIVLEGMFTSLDSPLLIG